MPPGRDCVSGNIIRSAGARMKPGNPWSVKGIQPAARQAAKEAARRHGMTLGQWLNHVIMDSNEEQKEPAAEQMPVSPPQQPAVQTPPQPPRQQQPAAPLVVPQQPVQPLATQQPVGTPPKPQHLHDKIEDLAAKLDTIVNKQSGQVDLDQWDAGRAGSTGWSDLAVRNVIREETTETITTQPAPTPAPAPAPAPAPQPEIKAEIFGERISALTNKLDSVVQAKAATKTRSDQNLVELETALRNIINHIEASDRQNTDVMKGIQARLSELSSRNTVANSSAVQQLTNTVSEIDTRLSHLSQRILNTEFGSGELLQLEDKVNSLANRLDNSLDRETEPQVLALEEQMKQLGFQLNELLRASNDKGADDQYDARINEISGRLQTTEQHYHKLSALEDSINQLFEAVEQNRNAAQENIFSASQKSIETMEALVDQAAKKAAEKAAQRSAEHVAAIMADDGLNKKEVTASITELRNEMHKLQEATIEAARHSAEEKISADLSSQAAKALAEPMMGLRKEIEELQSSSRSAELRNQDTLEAVHDTLEKVVERLVTLETSPPQQSDRPPLPSLSIPEINVVSSPETDKSEQETDEENDEPELTEGTIPAEKEWSEPEADPDTYGTPSDTSSLSVHDRRIDPTFDEPEVDEKSKENENFSRPAPALNHNYLEAARRAALAASQMPRNLPDVGAYEKANQKHVSETKSKMADMATQSDKKRKTLLLVAAAVLLVIGALSAGSLVTGKALNFSGSSATPSATVASTGKPAGTIAKANKKSEDETVATPQKIVKPAISPVSQNANRSPVKVVKVSPSELSSGQSSARNPAETPQSRDIASASINSSTAPNITASIAAPDQSAATLNTQSPAKSVRIARVSAPTENRTSVINDTRRAAEQTPLPPEAIGPLALRRAAAAGDATAQFEIAARFTTGKLVPQNFGKAIYWYQKAAAQGLAPAQYRLGTFYEKGRGVAKDKTAARIWYERAAAKGNLKAIHNLAVIYADGSKGKPDFAKAGLWFRKAAELGLADSQYNLAILHDRGLGVSKDPTKAYFWFQIAGSQGDKDAEARASIIEKRMTADQIARTKLLISNWRPTTLNKSANEVSQPFDGWQTARSIPTTVTTSNNSEFTQKELVVLTQGYLARLGFDPGPRDGIIGEQTRQAIEEFQQQHQLPVSGTVSLKLVSKLKAAAG